MTPSPLPLRYRTPPEWGREVIKDPIALLIDHALLEKKAATNALELLTRWPGNWVPGWVETMTAVARDEAVHLAQVTRILLRRGGKLNRMHRNPYATALHLLVRKGTAGEAVDRLLVSALIEARSCERFSCLAAAAASVDEELAGFYQRLHASELGHFTTFLRLARKIDIHADARWEELLDHEVRILAQQDPGPRIHSGVSVCT